MKAACLPPLRRLALAAGLLALNASGAPGQEASSGVDPFRAHCATCHATRPGAVSAIPGPNLGGIYGRAAGSLPGYPYSAALAGANFTWDAAKLDAWLTDPEALVPGTTMRTRIADPAVRLQIIEWLEQQH